MIRTYTKKRMRMVQAALFVLDCVVLIAIFTTFFLIKNVYVWAAITAIAAWFLIIPFRYGEDFTSLYQKYVFPESGEDGEYFADDVWTRKKYLHGMCVTDIDPSPIRVAHTVAFAENDWIVKCSIAALACPDIEGIQAYANVQRVWRKNATTLTDVINDSFDMVAGEKGFMTSKMCVRVVLEKTLQNYGYVMKTFTHTVEKVECLIG